MINAVLVDDEKYALMELEYLLKKYPEISIAGMYRNPLEAIEKIEVLRPEIVFLDINMPKLKGIDTASRILDISPETDIIFVTAFDRYAIEAFELHALDYVLKPVEPERFEKTMGRILKKKPSISKEHSQKLKIKCLGNFRIGWEGQEPIKWRTEKTKELFAFLLFNWGRSIPKEELLEKLWGDELADRAIKQLYNGVYYIRKTLESYGVDKSLLSLENNYSLKLGEVEYDIRSFCELYNSMDDESFEGVKEMETLYEGNFLEGEFYPWAELERDRLSRMYEQCVARFSEYYTEKRKFDKAEEILKKAFSKNPYAESITEHLLMLYKKTGNRLDAARHFNTYAKLVRQELGVLPGERLKELADF